VAGQHPGALADASTKQQANWHSTVGGLSVTRCSQPTSYAKLNSITWLHCSSYARISGESERWEHTAWSGEYSERIHSSPIPLNHPIAMRPEQKRLLKLGCVATLGLFVALLAIVLAVSPQLRQRVERRLYPSAADTVQTATDTIAPSPSR
jgi:hypothetical protein